MKHRFFLSLVLILSLMVSVCCSPAMAASGCGISGCLCTNCQEVRTGNYPNYPGPAPTYHFYETKCSTCSAIRFHTEPHTFSGDTCPKCGYTRCSHSSTTTSWSGCNYTRKCTSCGEVVSTGASHSYSYGSWSYQSDNQHKRTGTCTKCGATTTSYGSHSKTIKYVHLSEEQHSCVSFCEDCNSTFGSVSYEDHMDTNVDGLCDACQYSMTRFSVTVPTSMVMTVSQNGAVSSATTAAIENHSTAAVKLTGLRVAAANGWGLAPFASDLSAAKVDSRQIGFRIAGCDTVLQGTQEQLDVTQLSDIPKAGVLPLPYTAVISAMSQPINEQILTVEFTVDWA